MILERTLAEIWLDLQGRYDLWQARVSASSDGIEEIEPLGD